MRWSSCLLIGLLIARYMLARENSQPDLLERLREAGF